jgi:hypothetical protein
VATAVEAVIRRYGAGCDPQPLLATTMMMAMTGCGDGVPAAQRPTAGSVLPLPSNGWKDGDPVMLATTDGRLHVTSVGNTACAWLGETRGPFLWPEGWRVRFNDPAELLDDQDRVVAVEGDHLETAGGTDQGSAGPCGQAEWSVNGRPTPSKQ